MAHFEASLRLQRENNDLTGVVVTLSSLGRGAWRQGGHNDLAETSVDECLLLAREHGDLWCAALALQFLGLSALARGDAQLATVRAEGKAWRFGESLVTAEGIGYSLLDPGRSRARQR